MDIVAQYMKEVDQFPLLTKDEEYNLLLRIKRDKDKNAEEKFIKANMRLVIAIARKYAKNRDELPDLIGYGNIGLIRAVHLYNLDLLSPYTHKRNAFSTYATCWIKNYILRSKKNHPLGFQSGILFFINEIRKIISELKREYPHAIPDAKTITEKLRKKKMFQNTMVETVQSVLDRALRIKVIPLTSTFFDDDDTSDINEYHAQNRKSHEEDSKREEELHEIRIFVRNVVGELNRRDQDIINLRFGLDGDPPMTLEEIGKIFKVSRERIRQLEDIALRRIKLRLKSDDYKCAREYLPVAVAHKKNKS